MMKGNFPDLEDKMKEILIIGGGVAGLSAGIYAQLNGCHAVICEQHRIPGGCLTAWDREGYHIDNCIHWLTGTNPHSDLYALWRELGVLTEDTAIYEREALYTFAGGKQRLSLSRDLNAFHAAMLALSPRDEREIRRFTDAIRTLQGALGMAGKAHDEVYSPAKLIAGLPDLVRYYRLSLRQLADRFTHPVIRHFLLSFLPEGFGTLGLLYVFANFCGGSADLPLGGSEVMAQRLTDRFLSLGGTLLTGKRAVRLTADGRRAVSVTVSDGEVLLADAFIVTADPAQVFGTLTDRPMPRALRLRYERLRRFSAYHCAFACELPAPPFEGDVTLLIPKELQKKMHSRYLLVRCDSHEGDYAPAGRSLIQVMVYCGEKTSRALIRARKTDRQAYADFKDTTAQIIRRLLEEQYPALAGTLRVIDTWTPASYRRYVGSQIGSFMSFALPEKYLPLEMSNTVRGFDNVMLAGQWLQPPGGLPIAALSGKHAVERIIGIRKK